MRPRSLTAQQDKAAALVAADELTDERIAAEIGIGRATLARWKDLPAFSERVAVVSQELEAETLKFAIAKRRNRVKALNDRWHRLQRVIAERATDPQMTRVPGGTTGLLVHQERAIGTGPNQQIIDEYQVDTATLKELREHEKQAAQEIGQWTEKHEQAGDVVFRFVYDDSN